MHELALPYRFEQMSAHQAACPISTHPDVLALRRLVNAGCPNTAPEDSNSLCKRTDVAQSGTGRRARRRTAWQPARLTSKTRQPYRTGRPIRTRAALTGGVPPFFPDFCLGILDRHSVLDLGDHAYDLQFAIVVEGPTFLSRTMGP